VLTALFFDVISYKAARYRMLRITLFALSLRKCKACGTCFFSTTYVSTKTPHKVRSTIFIWIRQVKTSP